MTKSIESLRLEARTAANRGDLQRARLSLMTALSETDAPEDEYVKATAALAELCAGEGDFRRALTLEWYAGSERSQRPLVERVPAIDRARTLMAWAEAARENPKRRTSLCGKAADEYESVGLIAQAAIAREHAEDFHRARALWSRLANVLAAHESDIYAAALARFNLARTAARTGDASAEREAVIAAVHLIEEAADRFESAGQRERSFDCYQVLLAIGREGDAFEHVLEGYVNVIRILREDHLRNYALQSYEEVILAAEKRQEFAAAATLAREMAAYARSEGLAAVANHATLAQARLWQEVALASQAQGLPPDLAENALLSRIAALGEVSQFRSVGETFAALSQLGAEDARRQHYARAISRYANVDDATIASSPLPPHLRHDVAFPDVWHVDLIEWEQGGSASQACGDILLSAKTWLESTRRKAMLARLTALDMEAPPPEGHRTSPVELAVRLAEQLSFVELYAILSPLEHLFRAPDPRVRAAVVRTLSRFFFKRTFITLRAALADPHPDVVTEATAAMRELHFPHAFEPIARIYREATAPKVRVAALQALVKIDTAEAAEMVLCIVQDGTDAERAAAIEAMPNANSSRLAEAARDRLPLMNLAAQKALKAALRR